MNKLFLILALLLINSPRILPGHPLKTEDCFYLGRGSFELEVASEFYFDLNNDLFFLPLTISLGIDDNLDLKLGIPLQSASGRGLRDISSDIFLAELKYIFYEKDNFMIGIKPAFAYPAFNIQSEQEFNYHLSFMITNQTENFNIHLNAVYTRNKNRADEKKWLWSFLAAAEFSAEENLTLLAEIGTSRNPDKMLTGIPVYALTGFAFNISNSITLDFGIHYGITKYEINSGIMSGITIGL